MRKFTEKETYTEDKRMLLAVPVAAIIKIVCANIPELEPVAVLMSKD